MSAQFDETRFPVKIAFGFEGGPRFFTAITSTSGGAEQRNANWSLARAQYRSAHKLKDQEELDELLAFFYARRGKQVGFRFKDHVDYCSDMEGYVTIIATVLEDALPAAGVLTAQGLGAGAVITRSDISVTDGVGVITIATVAGSFSGYVVGRSVIMAGWTTTATALNAVTFEIQSIADDALSMVLIDTTGVGVGKSAGDTVTVTVNAFPLLKTYSAIAGTDYIRNITKPVSSAAVRVYLDAVEETNVTINTATGVVTFDATFEPTLAEIVTADYLFDVPVRFDIDEFSASLEHFNLSDWDGIRLVEVREL